MKVLKKNQIIIYSFVLMLMVAGYFNYTENVKKASVQTSIDIESKTDEKLADIGDATLVSSSDVITKKEEKEEKEENQKNKENKENKQNKGEEENMDNIETNGRVDDYFAKSKLERDTMYSEIVETYENILNSPNSTEEQKQTVVQKVADINDIKNKIMIAENLLETKGFINAVVFVNEKSVNVVVDADKLETNEVAKIQNVISREMNSKVGDIHISTK